VTATLVPAVKFCGLTQPEDARAAAAAGAAYAGVIFAGGPRLLSPARAAEVLDAAGSAVRRVGVFGRVAAREIGETAGIAGLHIVQLHGDPTAADVDAVRREFDGPVWAVLRVSGETLPPTASSLFRTADGVVLDAHVPGALGGTGVALYWTALQNEVDRARAVGGALLVLAGGLRADNVVEAVRALTPDVVDVSSGVERAPGIKDPTLLRAFASAVRSSNRT
jgi:phosphoribosylanthranilate isomerase